MDGVKGVVEIASIQINIAIQIDAQESHLAADGERNLIDQGHLYQRLIRGLKIIFHLAALNQDLQLPIHKAIIASAPGHIDRHRAELLNPIGQRPQPALVIAQFRGQFRF